MLELSLDNGFGIQTHPVFQNCGVETAEVQVGDQVALLQILGLAGRIFAVEAALNRFAQYEGRAGRAVVGAGTIIPHPAPELREHDHYHVIVGIVFLQVGEEIADPGANIVPQAGVHPRLIGVGIEAAVVAVEDAGAQIGQMDSERYP